MKGPCNKRQIERNIRPAIDKPTIYKAIKYLEKERRYLRVVKRRNGGMVKYFDLTSRGVVTVISELDPLKSTSMLDHIADKYRSIMPGIFDVWHLLKQQGLGELARERLRAFAKEKISIFQELEEYIGVGEKESSHYSQPLADDQFWDPFWTPWEPRVTLGDALNVRVRKLDEFGKKQTKWMEGIAGLDIPRERSIRHLMGQTQLFVSRANHALKSLGASQVQVNTAEETERLDTEIQNLRLAVRMLQDASGLKFVKRSGNQKA